MEDVKLHGLSKSCTPCTVTNETDVLRYFLSKEISNVDELIALTEVLGEELCETKKKIQQCTVSCESVTKIYDLLISEISSNHFTISDIIKLLFLQKHYILAKKLFWCYNDIKPGRKILIVYKIPERNSENTTSYFIRIKNLVHARAFANPYEHVRNLGRNVKSKLGSSITERERQMLCDKYVVLKAIEYDAGSNVSKMAQEDDETFLEMENVVDQTSVPSISRVLLYGRKADALSTLKLFDRGETMLTEAYVCADTISPCLETVDMVYKGVVFKLSAFEQNPTKEIQEEIKFDAHRALTLLSQETEDDQKFWKILLILRMVFALIGIGKQCRVIRNYLPSESSVTEADHLLKTVRWEEIDHRKQMFYFTARARLCELKGQSAWCIYYLQKAMILAIMGNYSEKKFINEYGETLGNDLTYLYRYVEEDRPPIHLNPPIDIEEQSESLHFLQNEMENLNTDDRPSDFRNIIPAANTVVEQDQLDSGSSSISLFGDAESSPELTTTTDSTDLTDYSLSLSSISSLS